MHDSQKVQTFFTPFTKLCHLAQSHKRYPPTSRLTSFAQSSWTANPLTDKPTNAVSISRASVEPGAKLGVASSEPFDQRQLMAAHQTLMQMGFFRCRATRSYLWESPHRFWALVSKGSGYATAPCGHVVSWLGTGCSRRWGWGRVPSTLIVARGQRVGANSNNQVMN